MEGTRSPCGDIQNSYPLIRKLVKLMEDPISAEFLDRHITLLDEFLRSCTYAFWVRDLPYIIRLIGLLSGKLDEVPSFRPYFQQILQICCIPPMLTRSSEILEYQRDLQEYFSSFGYLLASLKDIDLQDMVFQAIKCLLTRQFTVGICCVSLKVCKTAAAESHLPEIVTILLEISEKTYYKKLLRLTGLLVQSDEISRVMAKGNILNILILRLIPGNEKMPGSTSILKMTENKFRRTDLLDATLRIILPVLDACQRSSEKFKNELEPPNSTAWKWFHYVFRMLSMDALAKRQRNATMIIIILCVEIFSNIPVVGILPDDVAILCSAAVSEASGTWASEIKFTTDEYDFRFMQMILLLLCYHTKYPDSFKYFFKRESLARILLLINTKVQLIWTVKQRCALIMLSLRVLTALASIVMDQFVLYDGPLRLLSLCKTYMTEGMWEEVLYASLQCLYSTVREEGAVVISKYREKFGIDVMIGVVDHLLSKDILSMNTQECVTYAFIILQYLNKGYDYSNEKVITICLPYVKRTLYPKDGDMVQNPRLLMAFLNFLWENFRWSSSNLNYFVTQGGVFDLLDIVETCCFPVKLLGLGMLVDLCEEGACIAHLLTWRGHKTTLIPMLLKLFRLEDKKRGVKRTSRGVIEDVELPLMGKLQREKTFEFEKDINSSPATLDLFGSCRPKIYSILHLLNCRYKDKVNAVNEIYKISNDQYSIKDQITKLIAENYLPLKLGEVWVEVSRDLKKASVKPLAFDQQLLSTIIYRYYTWSAHIKTVQEELLKREQFQEGVNERLLYNLLRETRLASSLQALRELRYIARSTETLFRLMAKMKQKDRVQATLNYGDEFFGEFHRTFNTTVGVTPVFNQKITVESNIIINPNEEPFDLQPISSSDTTISFYKPGSRSTTSSTTNTII